MKTVCKKLFSLLLVAVLLVSVLPFQALAAETTTFHFYKYDFAASDYVLVSTQTKNAGLANYHGKDPAIQAESGWKFAGWVQYSAGMTFDQVNSATRVNEHHDLFDCGTVYLAAAYTQDLASVEFITNVDGVGADVTKPANINFINNMVFGYTSAWVYPASTPNGYTFGGWKYGDTVLTSANWASVVFKSSTSTKLYAYWIPNNLTVTFYRFNDSVKGYEAIKAVTVPYGKTVNINDIPALSDLNARDKYEAIGWQTSAGTDAVAVEPSTATITKDTGFYARYLGDEFKIKLEMNDTSLKDGEKTVRIGEKVGAYGGKLPTPELTGYVFVGWYDQNDNQVTDESIFWNSYTTLYAKWASQGNVRLIVYKEGDTMNPIVDRMIPNGIKGGTLDVTTIQLGNYLPAGTTYKLTGYFNKAGWDDYVLNRILKTVDYIQVSSTEQTLVYAMVTPVNPPSNNGSGSNNTGSGNTSTTPADPSNPATGDNNMIVASMTVMTLSAAALVVFMQLRKRKMI